MYSKVCKWSQRGSLLGPFCQLEAGGRKNVPEACVFPLTGVVKAVKVKVPDVRGVGGGGERPRVFWPVHGGEARRLVRLYHRVGGAFNAPLHAQSVQQVPHQRGFACAQIAVQRDISIAQRGLRSELARKSAGVVFAEPSGVALVGATRSACARSAFYNLADMWCNSQLVPQMREWARELGFSQIGVAGVDLSSAEPGLSAWLARGFHGDMHYMAAHGLKRARPAELVPGTVSVITARMNYLPRGLQAGADGNADADADADAVGQGWQAFELGRLARPQEGVVSVYARGRDYHKVLRARLQKLSDRIAGAIGPFGHRVFTDSAPVLEAELAARSGQGWRGKHTLVLNREAGSMFFLGEIYVDMALPPSAPVTAHCGSCSACIDICPTQAIIAPHRLDARRCISYLTIEHAGPIPLELRPLLGNRIYGCDDCQLICPWNKFAQVSRLPDFDERKGLSGQQLVHLFAWDEPTFLRMTEGGPIRRIGHERWLRNVAVALGNALHQSSDAAVAQALRAALQLRAEDASALVREHVQWALERGWIFSKNRL